MVRPTDPMYSPSATTASTPETAWLISHSRGQASYVLCHVRLPTTMRTLCFNTNQQYCKRLYPAGECSGASQRLSLTANNILSHEETYVRPSDGDCDFHQHVIEHQALRKTAHRGVHRNGVKLRCAGASMSIAVRRLTRVVEIKASLQNSEPARYAGIAGSGRLAVRKNHGRQHWRARGDPNFQGDAAVSHSDGRL